MNRPESKTEFASQIAATIYRLPAETQQKVLTLVDLLLNAPAPMSGRAQLMIQNAAGGKEVTSDQCLLEIDSAIEYLRQDQSIGKANNVILSR